MSDPTPATPSRAAVAQAARRDLTQWLAANPGAVQSPVSQLLREFGRPISYSAAYRVLAGLGLRARRRNSSRYAPFWAQVNWDLPDAVLSTVWGTLAANIRTRRLRTRAPRPRWSVTATGPAFRRAVAAEGVKAAAFRGPRPV